MTYAFKDSLSPSSPLMAYSSQISWAKMSESYCFLVLYHKQLSI